MAIPCEVMQYVEHSRQNITGCADRFCFVACLCFILLLSAEMAGRQSSVLLAKGAEIRDVGEMVIIGNLLHCLVGVVQHEDAMADDGLEHQLLYGIATYRLDQHRQILGRQA